MPFGETPLRRTAADIGLDGVELGDPAQALGRDLRAAAVVDFAQFSPTMRPTVPELQRCAAFAAPAGQPIVTGIAVDLENEAGGRKDGYAGSRGEGECRSGAVPGAVYRARCWSVGAWCGDIVNLSAAAPGGPRKCAVKFVEQRFIVFVLVPAVADWYQALVKPDK